MTAKNQIRKDLLVRNHVKLKILAKEAKEHYRQAKEHYGIFLEHAIMCGEALNQAKALKKHGTWKKWLKENVDFSYPTAANCMLLAREWDKKYLTEARTTNPRLNSIKSVLEVIREHKLEEDNKKPKKIKDKPKTEKQQKEYDKQQEYLKVAISDAVENLWEFEFELLSEGFDDYFWPIWYQQLKKTVIKLKNKNPYIKYGEPDEYDWPPKLSKEDRKKELQELKQKLLLKSREKERRKKVKSKVIKN